MSFLVIFPALRWFARVIVITALLVGLLTVALVPSAYKSVAQAADSVSATMDPGPMNANTSQNRWKTMSLRARSWDASLQIVQLHPVLGVGSADESEAMRLHGSVKLTHGTVVVTHGAFLKAAVYSGLPATLLLLAAIISIGWPARRRHCMPVSKSDRSTFGRSMLMVSGVALFFQSIAADSTGYLVTWMWVGIVVSVAVESQCAATYSKGWIRRNQIHTSSCS
jgi:O-antigen ligase